MCRKAHLYNRLVVDFAVLIHGRRMHLQYFHTTLLVRLWYLYFAVESTRAEKRRVERVRLEHRRVHVRGEDLRVGVPDRFDCDVHVNEQRDINGMRRERIS